MQVTNIRNYQSQLPNSENPAQELEALIQEFRAAENSPAQQRAVLMKIKDFLEKNKALIEEECAHNGWNQGSKDWTQHFDTFFNHAIALIDADEFNPQTKPANFFDAINELLTPLQWLMSHKNSLN